MSWAVIVHDFDSVIFQIGPFALRWYALAYIGGLLLGWRYCRWLTALPPRLVTPLAFDDFLVWATLGVVLGGRVGYILFYKPIHYLSHPLDALMIWQGGMSFHGGMLGVLVAMILFARRRGLPLVGLADIVVCAAPIGLFFGRIANFINGELFGRPADPSQVPWAFLFYEGEDQTPVPRHPSQLYEAALEGLVLFLLLLVVVRRGGLERLGLTSGLFLIGYGAARIAAEFFRQPDQHLDFILPGISMGQVLSLPMILAGLAIIFALGRKA